MQIQNLLKKAACALTIAVAAVSVQAQTDQVQSGRTSVTFSEQFGATLVQFGLGASSIGPSQLQTGIGAGTFPISAGAIDLSTARGEFDHSGGFSLSRESTQVRLVNFVIDTTSTPVLTGLVIVNDKLVGRITLFDLQLPSGVALPLKPTADGVVSLQGVGLTLDNAAATALNGAFAVNAFQPGLNIGTANVISFVTP
jgi:hypothetical protein